MMFEELSDGDANPKAVISKTMLAHVMRRKMRSMGSQPRDRLSVPSGAANYGSSDQVCSPHVHRIILMRLPLRESSSVWTLVGTAPHRLHVRNEAGAARTLTAASCSNRSLTSPSSKRSDDD